MHKYTQKCINIQKPIVLYSESQLAIWQAFLTSLLTTSFDIYFWQAFLTSFFDTYLYIYYIFFYLLSYLLISIYVLFFIYIYYFFSTLYAKHYISLLFAPFLQAFWYIFAPLFNICLMYFPTHIHSLHIVINTFIYIFISLAERYSNFASKVSSMFFSLL